MTLKQDLKNHVAIVLDTSGSMHYIADSMVKVFNKQIEFLRKSSLLLEQETRVSVYEFNYDVKCLISDVDVARPMEINKLRCSGSTSLLDATGLAIEDMKMLPQKYGNHAFVIYVLTDGYENSSVNYDPKDFKKLINNLPENFTIASFVPDNNGVTMMRGYGLHPGNIEKWNATDQGIEEVGRKFEQSMTNYYTARSQGAVSSSTMFADLSNVKASDVKKTLQEVKKFNIVINEGVSAVHIKPLVESKLGITYYKGCAFYELVKNETVQASKNVAIQSKKDGKVYSGRDARDLLGLPHTGNVKLCPTNNKDWIIYIQSTSVNRNVIPKQRVLVF